MKQAFSPEEIAAIGEKIQAAIPSGLKLRGYFLFRGQIRERAGVTEEEWNAYTFSRVQAMADADRKRRSLRARLRRFGHWLRSHFRSAELA